MSHILSHNLNLNHHHLHPHPLHHHRQQQQQQLHPLDTHSPWSSHLFPSPVNDAFNYNYFSPSSASSSSSSSSSPTDSLFKMRLSPDTPASSTDCLPTHKVFDFSSSSPEEPMPPALPTVSIAAPLQSSVKRSSSSPSPPPVKKRTVGERISSKDFVPPDVSGLTKREARLVKNRAAAFLSRQRKREEFEAMEIRVAELEQENARLQSIATNPNASHPPPPPPVLASEVERLRAQLAAAEARERDLNAQLASKEAQPAVKLEASDSQFDLSTPSLPSSSKSNASLGLMVLLCALPNLLSVPGQSSQVPSFSLPTPQSSSSSSFDFNNLFDYEWANPAKDQSHIPTPKPSFNLPKRLEFADMDTDALRALGDLDISFDTIPSEDGKIRVRIIPSTSASSSRAGSPAASSSSSTSSSPSSSSSSISSASSSSSSIHAMKLDESTSTPTFATWGSDAESTSGFNAFASVGDFGLTSQDDPFLGIGGISDYLSSAGAMGYAQSPTSSVSSELPVVDAGASGRKRVRIALKSLPREGGEGGEWEVQVC